MEYLSGLKDKAFDAFIGIKRSIGNFKGDYIDRIGLSEDSLFYNYRYRSDEDDLMHHRWTRFLNYKKWGRNTYFLTGNKFVYSEEETQKDHDRLARNNESTELDESVKSYILYPYGATNAIHCRRMFVNKGDQVMPSIKNYRCSYRGEEVDMEKVRLVMNNLEISKFKKDESYPFSVNLDSQL